MGISFDSSAPWTAVFQFAARGHDYWGKHVIRPAHTFIARGGKNMTAEGINVSREAKQALAAFSGSGNSATSGEATAPGKRKSVAKEKSASTVHPLTLCYGPRRLRDLLQVRQGQGGRLPGALPARAVSPVPTLPRQDFHLLPSNLFDSFREPARARVELDEDELPRTASCPRVWSAPFRRGASACRRHPVCS